MCAWQRLLAVSLHHTRHSAKHAQVAARAGAASIAATEASTCDVADEGPFANTALAAASTTLLQCAAGAAARAAAADDAAAVLLFSVPALPLLLNTLLQLVPLQLRLVRRSLRFLY